MNRVTIVIAAVLVALAALLGAGCASAPRSFATPREGADALVTAIKADDAPAAEKILGRDGLEALRTGEEVADRANRERFLALYRERHELVEGEDGAVTLVVGNEQWPLPIPMREGGSGWWFDVEAGREEVLSRRIGRNELFAIAVCRAIVDAQEEYGAGAQGEYAQKFLSEPGKRDGLYWPTGAGEQASPLGQLIAEASREGYTAGRGAGGAPPSYHGYRYRILTSQGPSAPGGAMSYMEGGRLRKGFAVVAYPAEYGRTGVATFGATHAGVLYEADLGPSSGRIAPAMSRFDPDARWSIVDWTLVP